MSNCPPVIVGRVAGAFEMVVSGVNRFTVDGANTDQIYQVLTGVLSGSEVVTRMGRRYPANAIRGFARGRRVASSVSAIEFTK